MNQSGKTPQKRTGKRAEPPRAKSSRPPALPSEREALFVERRRPRSFLLSVLFTVIGLFFCVAVILTAAGAGAALGVARAYIETAPSLNQAQFEPSAQTSFIYDSHNNLITTFAGLEFREFVPIDQIPDMLKNAFIAVEDVRFYQHDGVDYKRLTSAVLNALRNTDAHGGSTITQQLIKNRVLTQEQTYRRKIQEAYLALELEDAFEKESILEAYLNDIALGESNYGVKSAAEDYFGKQLDALTIKECAMIAGLTQNPYYYNPRKNMYPGAAKRSFAATEDRTQVVLHSMYTAGFITREQYETAQDEKLVILETSKQKQPYEMPYFVEYAIDDIVDHMLNMRALPNTKQERSAIENELRTGGYHIYLTVDPELQKATEQIVDTWEDYPKMRDPAYTSKTETIAGVPVDIVQPQVAAVIIDYQTGELRTIIGGRERPPGAKRLLNRATSYTEVGSSIKPIAVYGPAMDNGVSPATVIYNFPAPIEGYGGKNGYPGGNNASLYGPITVRNGIRQSLNIVAARTLYERTSVTSSAEYLVKLGADPDKINLDGPGLALGTSGITPIQMASAYAAIGNQGEWLEPLSFTKVVDSKGKTIIDANEVRQKRQLYKPSTAWLLIDTLTGAVNSGTGTKAKIKDITVAGKTGTNDSYKSVYFCGLTPYYAASVYIGADDSTKHPLKDRTMGGDAAAPLWQRIMANAVEGLPDRPIMDVSTEELGLSKKTICPVSGLLATEACALDAGGKKPISDWFAPGTEPLLECNMHRIQRICSVSGKLATAYCPEASVKEQGVLFIPPDSPLGAFDPAMVKTHLPHAHFGEYEQSVENLSPSSPEYSQYYCDMHSAYAAPVSSDVRIQALNAASHVGAYLSANAGNLNISGVNRINDALRALNQHLQSLAADDVLQSSLNTLRAVFGEVTGMSIPAVTIVPDVYGSGSP